MKPDWEAIGAYFGIAGAFILAAAVPASKWGWLLFLGSNCAWIVFSLVQGFRKMLWQQAAFTLTSLLGIANAFFPGNPIQAAITRALS